LENWNGTSIQVKIPMKYLFGIVICTYNRCESLKKTLESLTHQACDWNSVAEIIIVDNNSTDGTQQLVHSYKTTFKTELIFLKEEKKGKSHALNLAINSSQSDVLVFTDDDVILDPHWLDEMIRFFNENNVDVLGGRVLALYPPKTPLWVRLNKKDLGGPHISYDRGEGIIDHSLRKLSEFPGVNVAYKREVFKTAGLYDTDLGPGKGTLFEDIEMFQRAQQTDKKIFYNGKALVWHPVEPKRMTLTYITQWSYRHGKSAAIIESMKTKETFPSIFGVPRYLLRRVITKLMKLFLAVFQPKLFLKCWNAFYFDLGMIAGYAKYKRFNAPQKI